MTEPTNEATDGDPIGDTQARLAALQRNSGPPALAARILAAGLGASMVLGLIAAMGWSDNRATGSDSSVTVTPTSPTSSPKASPTTGSNNAVSVVSTLATPVTAVPSTAPTVPPVVAVPVATPVPATVSPPAAAAIAAPTATPVATTRQSD